MATRRKTLPYAAAALIRSSIALNNDAIRTLRLVIDRPMTSEERYRLLARAMDALHQSAATLKELQQLQPEQEA
jgi:hypothetical protein